MDADVFKETEELRGKVPRSQYINDALRAHNRRMTVIRRRLNEMAEAEEKALLQNSMVGRRASSAVGGVLCHQVNSPQNPDTTTESNEDAAVPAAEEDAVPVS